MTTRRRGLAIGCGGVLGFAWTAVALDAVERALHWDARSADVLIGTSAGAEIVAALGAGRTPGDLLDALDGAPAADPVLAAHVAVDPGATPPLPRLGLPGLGLIGAGVRRGSVYTALSGVLPTGRGDANWLRAYGRALTPRGGWVEHPATWLVAADARTGERVAFGSPRAPRVDLGSAIAASWAIPGWFPPVPIDGRAFVDGGAVSSVSADLLVPLDLDEVVIVAPMTSAGGAPATGLSRVERLLRAQMTKGLDAEVAALRAAGTRVIRVEPGPAELAAMGPNFMDATRRPATLAAARRAVPARVAEAIRASVREGENV
ncbi:patatin-like phospholipase family protein [Nocardia neocaledoniensis]|uniref:patatin-like phospholipase family protein n=1 Tax=Nocardia neocaledoniensis TaxID=236511 RepID=UPI002457BE00|nr:patatin-like phospholipase family protein [Nocardia neocaledoniensis]